MLVLELLTWVGLIPGITFLVLGYVRRAFAARYEQTWGIIIPSGFIVARHTRIYRYLWRSVLDFDGRPQFEERLRRRGFDDVHTEPVDGWQKDIVHSFLARRPAVARP